MKCRITTLLFVLLGLVSKAQNLKTVTVTMQPKQECYLSIANAKVYNSSTALSVKNVLDFGMFLFNENVLEWYNLKPNNEKVPSKLTGTQTKINAISFDRDQFDKCKTSEDLKRMTSYITTNSFSHYAVIAHSADYYQRCFIFEKEDGKRGLLFMSKENDTDWKEEVRFE